MRSFLVVRENEVHLVVESAMKFLSIASVTSAALLAPSFGFTPTDSTTSLNQRFASMSSTNVTAAVEIEGMYYEMSLF